MAVAVVLLLLLLNVCAIGVPVPELPPVTPLASATLHEYVVPDTALLKAMLGAVPLQIDWAVGANVIAGDGFTITTTLVVLLHPLADKVIA